jgi:hypothetical protein
MLLSALQDFATEDEEIWCSGPEVSNRTWSYQEVYG